MGYMYIFSLDRLIMQCIINLGGLMICSGDELLSTLYRPDSALVCRPLFTYFRLK
jgi:hypothetical protein